MKKLLLPLAAVCSLLSAGVPAAIAGPTDYQVTGPILSMTDTTITVQKGKENWEIAKDATTKGASPDLKAGDKVTVHYTMTATSIEAKAPAGAKKATKGAKVAPVGSPAPASAAKPAAEAAPGASPAAQ